MRDLPRDPSHPMYDPKRDWVQRQRNAPLISSARSIAKLQTRATRVDEEQVAQAKQALDAMFQPLPSDAVAADGGAGVTSP